MDNNAAPNIVLTTPTNEEDMQKQANPNSEVKDSEKLIVATDLCKSYHGRQVVNNVTLYGKPGEVVGLLGPNGAGKTTSFYMVMGLIKPDSGTEYFPQINS